jgi:guanylate kinase
MASGTLYILSGASGCGKTTLLNDICGVGRAQFDPALNAVRAPKYSERPRRNELDDITQLSKITLDTVDVAYVINNTKYGLRLDEITELLERGQNAFIVLSDFRVVRRVKAKLGDRAKAVYVSSAIDPDRLRRIQEERLGFRPDEDQKRILAYHFARASAAARLNWWDRVSQCVSDLETDWRAYAVDSRSTEIRAQKIRAFHIRYIEHLYVFDHVVLNYTEDAPEEMSEQLRSIVNTKDADRAHRPASTPIFIVAAASGAGKGTLMEMLNLIGREDVRIVSKVAMRRPKDGDRIDGMIALERVEGDPVAEWPDWWDKETREAARKGVIPEIYDVRWAFHGKTQYAIARTEVERNVQAGLPQIVVSNMQMFERFRELWPRNCVFLYLHRLVSDEVHREFMRVKWSDDPLQAEIRVEERRHVHRDYVSRIGEFHHVLLNTAFQEDLYDQMFTLLEHYRRQ